MRYYIVIKDNKIVKAGRVNTREEIEEMIKDLDNVVSKDTYTNNYLAGDNIVTYVYLAS